MKQYNKNSSRKLERFLMKEAIEESEAYLLELENIKEEYLSSNERFNDLIFATEENEQKRMRIVNKIERVLEEMLEDLDGDCWNDDEIFDCEDGDDYITNRCDDDY